MRPVERRIVVERAHIEFRQVARRIQADCVSRGRVKVRRFRPEGIDVVAIANANVSLLMTLPDMFTAGFAPP